MISWRAAVAVISRPARLRRLPSAITISPLRRQFLGDVRRCAPAPRRRRAGAPGPARPCLRAASCRRVRTCCEKNRSLAASPRRPSAPAAACPSRRCAAASGSPAGSSVARSSKVNISALIRSAASRLRSSSAVMKRLSVWRSRLLKISAIISCASRRAVRARLDMNSVRSVRSTPSSTSFCTALHAQHAHDHFHGEALRQQRQHAGGMVGLDLGQHHGDGLRIFVLEIVGQHRLVHVAELVPHGAAGRAADFLHDLRRRGRAAAS